MRNHRLFTPALVLLALVACRASPANGQAADPDLPFSPDAGGTSRGTVPAASPAPQGGTLAVHDGTGNAGPLSLAAVSRLTLDGTYQGLPGARELRIDAIAPGGTLYGRLRAALKGGASGGSVRQGLEVRGAAIDLYHMIGTWQFVLTVDGTPLAAASIDIVD